jgi:hypothetical protein
VNSKEKINSALNHKSGPVPIDFGGFPTTGIHTTIIEELREHYGLEKRPVRVMEPFQMLGEIEDDLRAAMGIDTKPLWSPWTMFGFKNENYRPWKAPWGQELLVPEKFVVTEDNGGLSLYAGGDDSYPPSAFMPGSGYFFDSTIRQKPIVEEELNPEDNLEEFGPVSSEDLAWYRQAAGQLKGDQSFITGNLGGTAIGDIACVPGPGLKDPKGIRDVTEWYMATAMRQDYIHQVFDKQIGIAIENLKALHGVIGDAIGAAYICGNDFGTQNAPFCSVETFKSLYTPYYKRVNSWIHENTNWKTFKHSCGAVGPLIPEMIDAGFDILNPVQWTAAGMDMKHLKAEYGKDLVFWGGGVDTQKTLPFGTPEEVRAEVLMTCENFSKDGGFVFNSIHNIQAKTPIKNMVAMIEAVKEFNGG